MEITPQSFLTTTIFFPLSYMNQYMLAANNQNRQPCCNTSKSLSKTCLVTFHLLNYFEQIPPPLIIFTKLYETNCPNINMVLRRTKVLSKNTSFSSQTILSLLYASMITFNSQKQPIIYEVTKHWQLETS